MVTAEENLKLEPESVHVVSTPAAREANRDPGPRAGHPRGRRYRDQRTRRPPRLDRRRAPLRSKRIPDPGARSQDRRQGGRGALGGEKNGYQGSSVSCPHCGRAAEFHSHRDAGLTARDLTPALERVATLAGAVADSFEKGADLLEEMAGARLSESTVGRTTEDAGGRLADAVAGGATFGPKADWPWHKDYDGRP